MKKTLLLLLSFVATLGISAQKVVLDFTDPVGSWKLPLKAEAITSATQFSNGTYTITLSASTAAYAGGSEKNGYTYLMLGKQGSTLTLPAFDFAVGRIEVVGNAGASAATGMNIYVGDNEVSTATEGSVNTNNYVIAEGKQTAGTVYTLKITTAHNAQITKINIYEVGEGGGGGGDKPTPTDAVKISEAQQAAAGATVKVTGNVVAVSKSGVVLGDESGYIYYYNTAHGLALGDRVSVAGAVSAYGGFNQFTKDAQVEKLGTVTVEYPKAKVLDGAGLDAWLATPEIAYVQVAGTLNISGNYYNLNVEGAATAVGSLVAPTAEVLGEVTNGSKITVTGFAMYTSGSKYVNMVVTGITIGEKGEVTDITNTLETAYSVSEAIELIEAGKGLEQKVYVKGIISAPYKENPLVDLTYGNATFFISEDGTTESQQFEIYRGYDFGGVKFTTERLKLGNSVVFYGTLTKYGSTYETNQGAELVLLNGETGVKNIMINGAAGRTYDLQGREVRAAQRGLFIQNGQKVLR